MSALLEFECRVPIGGYKVMTFDERKFVGAGLDVVFNPPSSATDDERYLLSKWGMRIVPPFEPEDVAAGFEPEVREVLEPQSEVFRDYKSFHSVPSRHFKRFNLFDETHFVDFALTPAPIGDTEGARVLANRFGPLDAERRPEYVENWCFSILEMRQAVKKWEKARVTDDFTSIIRSVSRRTAVRYGYEYEKNRMDAHILLRRDPVNGAPRLCICPTTLMSALWTQLALAIDGSESLLTCVECKRWFTISAGEGRSDKKYCSDACRMRAYRKRRGKQ